MRTTVQHTTATEVQNPEVQKLIGDYHTSTHAAISAAVAIDPDDDNAFVYENETREPMKFDDGAYYGFEKDVDVYEVVEFTISET